ncbi:MAG: hypothetical protein ACREXG_06810, partial [Polaromonas sp.]
HSPLPAPAAIPVVGSVQQGLSAAYEYRSRFKHRRAADKRYSLGGIGTDQPKRDSPLWSQ